MTHKRDAANGNHMAGYECNILNNRGRDLH